MTLTVHIYHHINMPASKIITSPRHKELHSDRHQPQSCVVDSFTGDLIKCCAQITLRKTHDNHPEERTPYKSHMYGITTSQRTHSTPNTKINQLMMFRGIIGDDYENMLQKVVSMITIVTLPFFSE
jgi:hypothetical protein